MTATSRAPNYTFRTVAQVTRRLLSPSQVPILQQILASCTTSTAHGRRPRMLFPALLCGVAERKNTMGAALWSAFIVCRSMRRDHEGEDKTGAGGRKKSLAVQSYVRM